MAKLNQVVAVHKGAASSAAKELTEMYQRLAKRDQFLGFAKTYAPLSEEGPGAEKLPPESKKVQAVIDGPDGLLKAVQPALMRLMDVVASKEYSNCKATADVVVNGPQGPVVLLKAAPVTFLLFLEKQLVDFRTVVSKLPTLSPDETWSPDPVSGLWATAEKSTHRTKKVSKPLQLAAATDKHPAQVQMVTEDVLAGFWNQRQFSGETSPAQVRATLDRIETLQRAVQFARQEANSIEAEDVKVGAKVLAYVFG